jgi:flavin-dependent dehydrogenase
MRFLAHGYCGLADVGGGQANLCLVASPSKIEQVKSWAIHEFALPADQPWRSITPLQRAAVPPVHPGLLLVGDAARVVEPFTGEGILYALRSGELAAEAILHGDLTRFASAHRSLYRGRLWINLVARAACKHPSFASAFLKGARSCPSLLSWLTSKVTTAPAS